MNTGLACLAMLIALAPQGGLVQVHQDFSANPKWEGFNNRIIANDGPLVKQDFGWMPSSPIPGTRGAIGGTIWASTTPAFYALPFGRPLTLNDRLSASGKIVFNGKDIRGGAYIGFFNHERQEWRPWSSLAIRLALTESRGIMMSTDFMSGQWGGGGMLTDTNIPIDGSVHTWKLDYDPDGVGTKQWPVPSLRKYVTNQRQTADQIWEQAKKDDPHVTLDQIRQQLSRAMADGLVSLNSHKRGDFWTLKGKVEETQGTVTLQVDNRTFKFAVPKDRRNQPTVFDRFGIFNHQTYSREFAFVVADLTVNGEKIDLSHDPAWQGYYNRVQFQEQDFQRQDFGFSETSWAGGKIGEIGGTFYRVETTDPSCGYYGDRVGKLTLDDPLHFDGNICFTRGCTDAGMFFGFFDSNGNKVDLTPRANTGFLIDGLMGLSIDGPTRIGYYLNVVCAPTRASRRLVPGPIYLPTGVPTHVSFDYDPNANNGVGAITVKLGNQSFVVDLKRQQRQQKATFDHFGMASTRVGGKYVTVYLDDLTYTARRGPDYNPTAFEQKTTVVPYPKRGRAY